MAENDLFFKQLKPGEWGQWPAHLYNSYKKEGKSREQARELTIESLQEGDLKGLSSEEVEEFFRSQPMSENTSNSGKLAMAIDPYSYLNPFGGPLEGFGGVGAPGGVPPLPPTPEPLPLMDPGGLQQPQGWQQRREQQNILGGMPQPEPLPGVDPGGLQGAPGGMLPRPVPPMMGGGNVPNPVAPPIDPGFDPLGGVFVPGSPLDAINRSQNPMGPAVPPAQLPVGDPGGLAGQGAGGGWRFGDTALGQLWGKLTGGGGAQAGGLPGGTLPRGDPGGLQGADPFVGPRFEDAGPSGGPAPGVPLPRPRPTALAAKGGGGAAKAGAAGAQKPDVNKLIETLRGLSQPAAPDVVKPTSPRAAEFAAIRGGELLALLNQLSQGRGGARHFQLPSTLGQALAGRG